MGKFIRRRSIALLGLLLFVAMIAAMMGGSWFKQWSNLHAVGASLSDTQEGYVVTSVYTFVGLLVAFTFGMAIQRFDARRVLVVRDAIAIERLFLDAQLLPSPHRQTLVQLVRLYAENRLQLGSLSADDRRAPELLAENDRLLDELWSQSARAFESIKTLDFSSLFVAAVNGVIEMDALRKAARQAQIPGTIILLLMAFSILAASMIGYVLPGVRGELTSTILLVLFVVVNMVLADLSRPISGAIKESQEPMKRLVGKLSRPNFQATPELHLAITDP